MRRNYDVVMMLHEHVYVYISIYICVDEHTTDGVVD